MKPPQLELDLKTSVGWGGARDGAGSKAGPRPRVWHRARVEFPESHPGMVTIRVRKEVPSLRTVSLVHELERSFRETLERKKFRVTHYSIQRDHLHLMVEAEDAAALSCGMKCVCARLARAVNRVFARSGPVLDGRYHHRALGTPREVGNALAYVLLNARKHASAPAPASPEIDPASSGRWFDGWESPTPYAPRPAVARARTWLLRAGWQRHGLIRPDEIPGGRIPRMRRVRPV